MPVQAQEFNSREKSIFYAGFIMGAGTSYCAFQGEGKISDDYRRGFMEALLQEGVNDPLTNADKSVLFNVYEDIKDCDWSLQKDLGGLQSHPILDTI